MEIEKETFLPPKILFGLDENNSEVKYTLQETKNIFIIGASMTGKSNLLHYIIEQSLLNYKQEIELELFDAQSIEFNIYKDNAQVSFYCDKNEIETGFQKVLAKIRNREKILSENRIKDCKNFNELNNKNKLPYILVLIDEMRYLNTKSIEMLENILEKGNEMGVYVVVSSQLCNCKKIHNYFSTIFAGYRSKDHYIEMLLECPNLKKLELGEMYFKSPTIFSELKKIKIPYVCHNKNLLNIIKDE